MVETIGAGGGDVVGTLGWYCDAERGACPLITRGVPTWTDKHHLGAAGAMQRSALIAEALLPRLARAVAAPNGEPWGLARGPA